MQGTPNMLKPVKSGDRCNMCGKPISAADAKTSSPGFPFHESCRGPQVFSKKQ